MRIALFTDTYLPDINGVVSSIELLRTKLIEKGHDVYVVCTYASKQGNFKVIRDNNIIRLPGFEIKQMYGYAVTGPFHYNLIEDLKKLNFDLIHVHTEFGVGIFARIVAKKLNIPLIATYHTTYEDYTHYVNPMKFSLIEKGAKKAVAKLSKMYSDSCEYVISPSEKTKKMLVKYEIEENMIEVIPTGLDLKRFSPVNINQNKVDEIRASIGINDEKLLIYVGRIAEEKSLDMVISAMKYVKDQKAKVKLAIVGAGPDDENLKELVDNLNLNDVVYFLGKKPQEEVPSYYHASDAFVSASTTETQGMTYLEALSSGLMIFARHDDVVEDLIDEDVTGFFFDDVKSLSEKIVEFSLKDKEYLIENSKKCIAKTSVYDSDIFVEKILSLYRKVLKSYNEYYVIDEIKINNNHVKIKLSSLKDGDLELLMSVDHYFEYGLRKDSRISTTNYLKYKEEETILKVYLACIKKIIFKDYTVKQMYDFIINKFDLNIEQINLVIEKLEEKKYLDDNKYAKNKLLHYQNLFFSKNKIKRTLRSDGVSLDIINNCLEDYNMDDEFDFAYKKAQKYQKSIKDKSLKAKQRSIEQKLYVDGYSKDAIEEAMNRLDFSSDENNNINILRKKALKAKKRYERKASGTELRNKVFKYLYSQGFDISDIYVVIDEIDWSDLNA